MVMENVIDESYVRPLQNGKEDLDEMLRRKHERSIKTQRIWRSHVRNVVTGTVQKLI